MIDNYCPKDGKRDNRPKQAHARTEIEARQGSRYLKADQVAAERKEGFRQKEALTCRETIAVKGPKPAVIPSLSWSPSVKNETHVGLGLGLGLGSG
jgi:hypothetical protein